VLVFGFASFLAFGLVLVIVGANQAQLEREIGLSLAQTGLLSSALAAGLGVGVVGAGPLFDRYPRRPLFVGSMLLAAAALWSVEPGMGFDRWLVHLAVTGVGIGTYDTLLNAAVVQKFGARSARPMSVLHAAATLGAVAGPPLAGLLASRGHWIASFHGAGVAHLLLAAIVLFVPLPVPESRRPQDAWHDGGGWSPLLPFGAIAFAYVGIEAALTVFAVPYAGHLGLPTARGQLGISAFWLGLLCGRLSVLTLRSALDARVLTLAGAAGTFALVAGTLTPFSQLETTLFLTGVALGCVYPLMIALAGQAFPRARGTAAGLAAGAGALGGFGIPWLTGAIGDASGVGVAIASLAGWSALIAAAALAARRAG
jgi:MFS family permease